LAAALIERSCRHNQVYMRVIVKIAFMGVEDSMGTAAATQLGIAAFKAIDRLPGGFEQ